MLQKGLHLIEQQFPGYMQELQNAGALPIDHLTDMIFVSVKFSLVLTRSVDGVPGLCKACCMLP